MRSFVAALDDSSLPAASWRWRDVNSAVIQATMTPDQVIAVALNYHPGWSARSTGRQLRGHSDGLGLVVIEPECSGPCTAALGWGPGPPPPFVLSPSLLALLRGLPWVLYHPRP